MSYRIWLAAVLLFASLPAAAGEWTHWRGPHFTGVSDETGLISDWDPEGKNLAWKDPDFIGRSTPVVVDGRVCANGRVGEGIHMEAIVACWDAASGRRLWEDRFPVYNTTVPYNRVGWASLAADPVTGNVYAHGVAGQLIAYAPDGKILWQSFLTEEYGHLSGYGGRTQTPVIEGNQLLLTFVSSGWGAQSAPKHRFYSFNKDTGELIWVFDTKGRPHDMNTQGGPIVTDIGAQRLMIAGAADGAIYAVKVATGEMVWKFDFGRRGLNVTPVEHDGKIYIGHSEENLDDPKMGRLIAIDGTGKGDISSTAELWRINELSVGFPSPAYKDGKLYVIDNSANLYQIDAQTGTIDWEHSVGTVGKASPVWADGKLFVTETNGRVHILKPGKDGVEVLSSHELTVEDGRYAEIYGSPAIAYGRIYFTTEAGIYCLGDKSKKIDVPARPAMRELPAANPMHHPQWVQIEPAEVRVEPGAEVAFEARAFDAIGQVYKGKHRVTWALDGLQGKIDKKGRFRADPDAGVQTGSVKATIGEATGSSRVRVIPGLPWNEDFSGYEVGSVPPHWIGAKVKYEVQEKDGEKVLCKKFRPKGLLRNALYMGSSELSNYTIEGDLMGVQVKRRRADIGLINGGYTMDVLGNSQMLQIRTWPAEYRIMQEVDFPWEMGVWYRMRLRVDVDEDKAVVRGKVWKKGESEPGDWTLVVEDPNPIAAGSPGLIGYSPGDIYYDNIKVTVNE